jgi:ABC-type branched-subunit amino acid transport system ATPase component
VGMQQSRFTPDNLARLGLGRTWQDIRLFDTQSLADNIAVASPLQLGENPLWAVLRVLTLQLATLAHNPSRISFISWCK